MAQQLWLLRHGEAVPHGSRGSDGDRELTSLGERQAGAAGVALARLGIPFAACYTSPKVRARDTARLACEALDVAPEELPALAGGFDREAVLDLLAGHDADARVLVVGHNPDFPQLVHDVTGARAELKKGGVAALRLGSGRGELLLLLRPAELEAMAVGAAERSG